jgi:Na+-transporting NADH:ubiquinone oxidoreductase subunit D
MILFIVGFVRELLGSGSILGFRIIPQSFYDAGYVNNGMMTMPAMALILLGCVIWVHRSYFYKEEKK